MKKTIYKLNFDFSRNGKLEGLFVDTKERVAKLIESDIVVHFGEVLGKHSEVYGQIGPEHLKFVTDHKEVIENFEHFNMQCGFNPFHYDSCSGKNVGELVDELLNE